MRRAARGIIIRGDELLVIDRDKFGKKYLTLPGGRIEMGEQPEEAIRRELREEASIQVGECRLVFVEEAGDPYGTQYIFLCEYLGGEPELSESSEEAAINKLGQNIHTPKWESIDNLEEKSFVSEGLKQRIIAGHRDGFPQEVDHFSTA
jgi:8-oxo-dGTP diphosphatase